MFLLHDLRLEETLRYWRRARVDILENTASWLQVSLVLIENNMI